MGEVQAKEIVEAIGDDGPDAVIQVGLGHGHEVPTLHGAWPEIPFIAFEPHSELCARAKTSYPGTIIPSAVVGDNVLNSIEFFPKGSNPEASSLFPKKLSHTGMGIRVPVTTLDFYFLQHGWPGERILLWMDCEGSELEALRGGKETLRRSIWVEMECSTRPNRIGWPQAERLEEVMLASNFTRKLYQPPGRRGAYNALFRKR